VDTGEPFPGNKRLDRETEHSSPSSTELKKAWSCAFISHYISLIWCVRRGEILIGKPGGKSHWKDQSVDVKIVLNGSHGN
jgi:hypothetical protein